MSTQPLYEVVSPAGREPDAGARMAKRSPAAPLADLNGKRIGLVWTVFTNGNVLLEALRDLLAKRYRGMEFVELPPGRNTRWGEYPDRTIGDFARENRIDAAIVAAAC